MEPSANKLTLQHRFVSCVQENQTVTDYSLKFKKLAKECTFQCDCGKSVADMLLRMQSVRGILDSGIRVNIIQNIAITTFEDTVNLTVLLEPTIAPFHPASNSQAERFVQFVKNSLLAMADEPVDIEYKGGRLLSQIRKAPNSTGLSAYALMFKRCKNLTKHFVRKERNISLPKHKRDISN